MLLSPDEHESRDSHRPQHATGNPGFFWGYKANDHNFKSTQTLLHNLIDFASKGGNYLLNMGPDATGVIPQEEADRLTEIGKLGNQILPVSAEV